MALLTKDDAYELSNLFGSSVATKAAWNNTKTDRKYQAVTMQTEQEGVRTCTTFSLSALPKDAENVEHANFKTCKGEDGQWSVPEHVAL